MQICGPGLCGVNKMMNEMFCGAILCMFIDSQTLFTVWFSDSTMQSKTTAKNWHTIYCSLDLSLQSKDLAVTIPPFGYKP